MFFRFLYEIGVGFGVGIGIGVDDQSATSHRAHANAPPALFFTMLASRFLAEMH